MFLTHQLACSHLSLKGDLPMFQNNESAHTSDGAAPVDRLLPQVRLVQHERGVTVYPNLSSTAGNCDLAQPFELSQIPKSLTDRSALICQSFWHKHRRCLALVLMLDVKERYWSTVIPPQRSCRDSACWSAVRTDLPGILPSMVLLGSFQARMLGPKEEAIDCPPPHDGVHFVHCIGIDPQISLVRCFLRAEGRTEEVSAADILVDDGHMSIEEALPRIQLV
jgi:hypothetical protein